jgi:hypothetical protein
LAGGGISSAWQGISKAFCVNPALFLGKIWIIFAREREAFCEPTHVSPGLVPGIHAWKLARTSIVIYSGTAWLAGTSPAMTWQRAPMTLKVVPDSPAFPALSQLIRSPPILFLAESKRNG